MTHHYGMDKLQFTLMYLRKLFTTTQEAFDELPHALTRTDKVMWEALARACPQRQVKFLYICGRFINMSMASQVYL